MTIVKKISLAAMMLLLPLAATADNSGIAKLNQFVEQIHSFQAHFAQTVLGPEGNVVEQAEGEFQLERPGRFRWDYEQPYPQQIVADGERIWFYDVDLEQVTVKKQQEALADTPASLLSGQEVPEDQYHIRSLDSDDGLQWVELTPKQEDASFQSVTLAFDGDVLTQMVMRDSFDQRTRLSFSKVRQNPDFNDTTFRFTPPEGVDVVGDSGQ
jgi:outer membrane lipoprotein carrier protein